MMTIRGAIPLLTSSTLSVLLACSNDDRVTVDTGEAPATTTTITTTTVPTTTAPTTTAITSDPDPTTTHDDHDTTTAPSSSAPGDTSTDSSGDSSGDPTSVTDTTTTEPPGPTSCSEDLHDVLDERGDVLETCASDQACSFGQCVAVCDAIAAVGGTVGCDFWAPSPPFYGNGKGQAVDGPCFAVFLANAWDGPANITVTRGGQAIDVTAHGRIVQPDGGLAPLPPGGLPPEQVLVLFLSHRPGVKNFYSLECPVPPAVLADTAVSGAGIGDAFHVVSDAPVSAYDINPYGGPKTTLPSASLLLPATAWGTNHLAIAPKPTGSTMWALVVAREDNTTIKVAPPVAFPGGGPVAPAPAGQTTEYTLDAGQILQWAQPNNQFDPSGAVFDSDKPIGLWTGNTYLFVTSATSGPGGGDAAHQQISPVQAMGSEYVGAGVVSRLVNSAPESVPYRMVGAVAGTSLTYDPGPPPGAPLTLGAGEVAEFETVVPFAVRSQDPDHPFLFSQYMPGGGADGDEEWVSLPSSKQFQSRYTFATATTYSTTNLVLVRTRANNMFADVTIECLGIVTGWQPVGDEGRHQYAHVDLERDDVPVAACDVSHHVAESDGPFGVVVWGTDYYISYGYPAGSDTARITDVELPVPD